MVSVPAAMVGGACVAALAAVCRTSSIKPVTPAIRARRGEKDGRYGCIDVPFLWKEPLLAAYIVEQYVNCCSTKSGCQDFIKTRRQGVDNTRLPVFLSAVVDWADKRLV